MKKPYRTPMEHSDTSSLTKRYHYVPQFYLAYFLPDTKTGAKTFWVYDKDGGHPRPQTPINTAVESGFYSFESAPGTSDDVLERKVFGPIEQAAKPILDQWQTPGARLQPQDVPRMAAFLAFMHTRVPRAVQMVKEINEAAAVQINKDLAKDPDRLRALYERYKKTATDKVPSFEEIQESLLKFEENYEVEADSKAALIQSIEVAGPICDVLLKMHWCLCTAPRGQFFITGDTPLTVFAQMNKRQAIFSGLGLPQAEVSFPVSPTVCLFLNRRRPQRYRRVSEQFVRKINRKTAWMAERYVISTRQTKAVAAWVAEAALTRGMPKVDPAVIGKRFKGLAQKGT